MTRRVFRSNEMPETLTGLIERVTYHNPENGFAVLKVQVKGRQDLVTVVGNTTSVSAGEHLEATGKWVVDREHGQQFKADELKTTHPASAEGIEKYLASGAIRSIGPKLAAKIVGIYKERTLEIFETAPDFLLHIKGIGQERVKRIRQSWQEQKEVRKIMLFLAEHGISSGRAVRIYRTYGQESIAKIKENPYQLADDIRGIGFKTADELAAKLGIDRNSPYRARAAVQYTLQELASQGHCRLSRARRGRAHHEAGRDRPTDRRRGGAGCGGREGGHPGKHRGRILAVSDRPAPGRGRPGPIRSPDCLGHARIPCPGSTWKRPSPGSKGSWGSSWLPGNRRRSGRRASTRCWSSRAGRASARPPSSAASWKSSRPRNMKCVLAAPTGRAAKRLAETTGQTAKTIHRLLEFDPATGDFKRNQQNPLTGDLFVLDEVSMVDVVLGHQFFRAVPSNACVILVGDVDQLPSVGPGTVLADLIASGVVPVVRLTEIFRQAAESEIVTAAYAINQGRMPELKPPEGLIDFYFIEAPGARGHPGPDRAAGQGTDSQAVWLRSQDRHPGAHAR